MEGKQLQHPVYLVAGITLVIAIILAALLALHQHATDAGSSHVSPVSSSQYESAREMQSIPTEQTEPTQDTVVGNEGFSSLRQGDITIDVTELGPGAGNDDVDVAEPGPGEGHNYDDPLDAGPGANDVDIDGPGPGENDSGIHESGPGESSPTP